MSNEQFMKAWEQLSLIQRKAAEWDEGSLLVLAGPGSGKTRVLTCRIARILDASRNQNFRILALTFTNKAADEMRSRVSDLAPGQESRLFLGTFHSFCSDILRQHGTHLKINPNFRIYSQDADLQAVLNDAVDEAKKKSSLVSDLDRKTLPVIKGLKSRLILPENCMKDEVLRKNRQLAERMSIVYPEYEAQLAKRNTLDFNSLILKAYQLLEKFTVFAKFYRTVYPYICIDEFQDTNHAQYNLIRVLTGEQHRNLFIVADDDQVMYQWNGASHKRIDDFRKDYCPEVIQLPMNYRCPPEIVHLANNLIQHNFLRTLDKKPIEAFHQNYSENIVRLLPCFPNFDAEASEVAKDIKKFHGNNPSSVTILGRNRWLLNTVEAALRNEGLSAVISQRKDEFESTPFVWLHSTLRLANDRQDSKSLNAVCGTFSQLTEVKVDPEEVIIQANASNHDYLRHWIELGKLKASSHLAKEALLNTAKYLGEGRDFQGFSEFALSWFEQLVRNQPKNNEDPTAEVFVRYEEEKKVWQDLRKEITEYFCQAITLEAFLQELQMRSKESKIEDNTVTLMTVHGAKGKEFEHIYLIGMVEDELPSYQSKQKGDRSPEMEEERRNCYVAITRTIKYLTISYAGQYKGWDKKPSRFLYEMGLISRKDP
ncbi:MAG TPA: ATP-dependent helicase [Cyanobacteria bacterium UBA11149]|nr:ATP-dependent helicase [Cyanobacteria bacterium UBA11367]HBE56006.1 ATP-dependent helicase [Cyanobacteria bacterium UBA11366]HBK66118.1 ATP-dependent helicase [Cyanobacteria bacterium UBA11166]HBR74066.1 ATP-dependent helicase [Cyanobacteria bacterium UBA11159]HBS67730.1 ATP-dependent helicase [Cyanobacteria bacterium UBA11153]HBW91607.1 ATP-dependent helicase [Cyanobacteria bacterium UBA11149]HCA95754.1 ATP-dependent helicase [Cyanobacteria bacterium UBA9226]